MRPQWVGCSVGDPVCDEVHHFAVDFRTDLSKLFALESAGRAIIDRVASVIATMCYPCFQPLIPSLSLTSSTIIICEADAMNKQTKQIAVLVALIAATAVIWSSNRRQNPASKKAISIPLSPTGWDASDLGIRWSEIEA